MRVAWVRARAGPGPRPGQAQGPGSGSGSRAGLGPGCARTIVAVRQQPGGRGHDNVDQRVQRLAVRPLFWTVIGCRYDGERRSSKAVRGKPQGRTRRSAPVSAMARTGAWWDKLLITFCGRFLCDGQMGKGKGERGLGRGRTRTWVQSSRLGASTAARGRPNLRSALPATSSSRSFWISGSRYASVLPDPGAGQGPTVGARARSEGREERGRGRGEARARARRGRNAG